MDMCTLCTEYLLEPHGVPPVNVPHVPPPLASAGARAADDLLSGQPTDEATAISTSHSARQSCGYLLAMNCTHLVHKGSHASSYISSRYGSTTTAKAPPRAKAKPSTVKPATASPPPPPPPPLTPPPSQTPSPQSSPLAFSPKQLNAFAVSDLSFRAHPSRRPPQIYDGRLPDKYKPAARRITYAMVAMPIVIVTSYMLWARCK